MSKRYKAIVRAFRHGWRIMRWEHGTTAVMGRGMRHSEYLILIDAYGNVRNGY